MAYLRVLFIFTALLFLPATPKSDSPQQGFISMIISQKGLDFAKDILINQAISSLIPLELPSIQKSKKIPILGSVRVVLSNITIDRIDVISSYVKPGSTGVAIVASGATANLSMDWYYSYTTWVFVPIKVSDRGSAFIKVRFRIGELSDFAVNMSVLYSFSDKVEGMEVGLTLGLENQGGMLKLTPKECGCYVKSISISLNGGASWFYQGFVDAFEDQIRSAVENTISKKIKEGTIKLDSLLQTIPREFPIDNVASLNVTFVNEPSLGNSSIGVEINGLFTSMNNVSLPSHYRNSYQTSVFCKDGEKMLGISLDELVFDSGASIYFDAGIMQWMVDKVPDQSLLNTASWKFLIPQLYRKFPNDDMKLNISFTSPPVIRILPDKIEATIYSDMTIDVLDANEIVSVACVSMVRFSIRHESP
ncbi:hypothetical protein Sjap_002936 [Stephania japonica]|uniref:Uncharacterized protein n=1 Tax=Stephania japonica TaxID=461633 RepID=A0AAP0PWL1_9MAGN